jgi:Adenylate and Guanylate cyclase catalytic domain
MATSRTEWNGLVSASLSVLSDQGNIGVEQDGWRVGFRHASGDPFDREGKLSRIAGRSGELEWRGWCVDGHGGDVGGQLQINRSPFEPAAPQDSVDFPRPIGWLPNAPSKPGSLSPKRCRSSGPSLALLCECASVLPRDSWWSATSLALAAAQEQAVVGETPNLAARLQAVAEPGAVVISASTHLLSGGLFDYRNLGPIALKGLARMYPRGRCWVQAPLRAALRRNDAEV